ncbi:DNA polymerase [Mycobacteroides abscessus]|uniref:DNA polymerase n=1 Tax=Mycobacteroides abscessus TaxID=36809 RepID=UPI0026708AFA|nr:DNA polymerase [Mycobacteroides abscessus]MDO3110440.1 DNA polymerase [Mycobacteroides abscessus subsp. abscessus]
MTALTLPVPTPTSLPGWATVYAVPSGEDPTPAIEALRRSLTPETILAVDVETNALAIGDPAHRTRTIQLGSPQVAVVLHADDPGHVAAAREMLDRAWLITAHNASFDIQRLTQLGVFDSIAHGWERMADTMLLARIIEPPSIQPSAMYGLKGQAESWFPEYAVSQTAKHDLERLFKRNKWLGLASGWDAYKPGRRGNKADSPLYTAQGWMERNGWMHVPTDAPEFIAYAAADVLDGARLAATLYPLACATAQVSATAEHRLARIACEMEYRGVRLDREWAQARLTDAETERDTAKAELAALGVTDPSKDSSIAAAIGAEGYVLPKTNAGAYSTTEEALDAATAAGSKVSEPVIRYRKAHKLTSTYYGAYLRTPGDRVHCSISTLEAKTGRMSASRPNLQNVPGRKTEGVRECFLADPGHVIVSCDFSSVEMRVAAALTGDPALRRLYVEGGDPYWMIAREAYGAGATKDQRGQVKAFVLGRMYGGGIATLSANQGWSEDEGKRLIAVLDKTFPYIKKLSRQLQDRLGSGYPGWINEAGRFQICEWTSPHTILNYRIQGLARDLLAQALFRAEDAGLGEAFLLPIHDEILIQVPEDRADELTGVLVEAMHTTLPVAADAPGRRDPKSAGLPAEVDIPAEANILGPRWRTK